MVFSSSSGALLSQAKDSSTLSGNGMALAID